MEDEEEEEEEEDKEEEEEKEELHFNNSDTKEVTLSAAQIPMEVKHDLWKDINPTKFEKFIIFCLPVWYLQGVM